MKKAQKHILTVCFLLFIFVGMILNISNIKNACVSVIGDIKSLDIKAAVTNFESSINENFANKMEIVDVNGAFKKACGQKIANGTIIGSNNQLYDEDAINEKIDVAKEKESLEYTSRLMDYAESKGIFTLYVQHPNKYNVASKELPYGLATTRTIIDDMYIQELKEQGKNVIDLRESKYNMNNFYKTDHHWTVESAFNANQIIKEYISQSQSEYAIETNNKVDDYKKVTKQNSLLGSYGIRVGQYFVGKDDYSVMIPEFNTQYTYEAYDTNHKKVAEKEGTYEDVFIEKSYLNTPDYLNKYNTYILDGTVEARAINKKSNNDTKVLLIGDSFSRPLFTFLSDGVSEIRFLDAQEGRYNDSFKGYIDEYNPDILLIMYNYGFSNNTLMKDSFL